jgi:3-deoxy-7-phosphoheptulonate synthase
MAMQWTPDGWRAKPIAVPEFPDPARLAAVEAQPLVFAGEARKLKRKLARVAEGKGFLLQGGDCAEALPSTRPTTSGISSGCSCRWQ